MPRRSELTAQQRRDAVLVLLRKEEPASQLARRLGVSEPTLSRWQDEFLAGGEAALSGGQNGAAAQAREKQLRVTLWQDGYHFRPRRRPVDCMICLRRSKLRLFRLGHGQRP
jgi:transposase-like protein